MQTATVILKLAIGMAIIATLLGQELPAKEYAVQVLHVFSSPGPGFPSSGVARTSDGSLYGVTPQGNALESGNGSGTIYRFAPDGTLSVLAVFNGINGPSGYYPTAGLVLGNDGNFYGSPRTSGDGSAISFFRITPGGFFTNICSVYGLTNSLMQDYAMILASDGNFYGTTTYGGAGYNEAGGSSGGGTVFRLTPDGGYTLLNSFTGTNGEGPCGRLMQASNGEIYGVTAFGGAANWGTLFSISTNGLFHNLYSFTNADAASPQTGLVEGDDGWLYGMAVGNGYEGHGSIYKVRTNGDFAIVASFNGSNGRYPCGSLVKGNQEEMYGLTKLGGASDGGTLFRLTTNNAIEVLTSFDDGTGRWPTELTKGGDGNFYGTTAVVGGPFGNGTVFRLVQVPEVNLTLQANGSSLLKWDAFSGGVYQVEHKRFLSDANWNSLSGRITAATNLASFADSPAAVTSGFYRISLLPW